MRHCKEPAAKTSNATHPFHSQILPWSLSAHVRVSWPEIRGKFDEGCMRARLPTKATLPCPGPQHSSRAVKTIPAACGSTHRLITAPSLQRKGACTHKYTNSAYTRAPSPALIRLIQLFTSQEKISGPLLRLAKAAMPGSRPACAAGSCRLPCRHDGARFRGQRSLDP